MKIIQNYLQDSEYEYAEEYNSIEEAKKVISEYEAEDKTEEKSFNYTIVDNDYEDIEEKQREDFREMSMQAMKDIGLTEDEAEMQFEDIMGY